MAGARDFSTAFDLRDQVVVVTGAGGGIGQCLASAFAERGARLAPLDRDPSVQAMAGRCGDASGFVLDRAGEQEVAGTVDAIAAAFGGIDVLVNNNSIGHVGAAESIPTVDWNGVVSINLGAQYLVARAVAPPMLPRGYSRVVFMALQAAVAGLDQHAAYRAARTGLLGMSRCMALHGDRVGPARDHGQLRVVHRGQLADGAGRLGRREELARRTGGPGPRSRPGASPSRRRWRSACCSWSAVARP